MSLSLVLGFDTLRAALRLACLTAVWLELAVLPSALAAAEPASASRTNPAELQDTDVPYGVGDWPESLGNHRARISVTQAADVAWVRVPWRRRDDRPESKEIIVMDSARGQRVTNVVSVNINREYGDLLFQPTTVPGEYHIYYLPHRVEGWWAFPTVVYLPPTNLCDRRWAESCEPARRQLAESKTPALPAGKVEEIQALNEFHRFDPMEVAATTNEVRELLLRQSGKQYLLFPEDRRFPIRMPDAIPLRWVRRGSARGFEGTAQRGEFYAFQVGVWAFGKELRQLSVQFTNLKAAGAKPIPARAMRCFNLGGTNWLGQSFRKNVHVAQGAVQALWIGVQVPGGAAPGTYRGVLSVRPANAPAEAVELKLTVVDQVCQDSGDGELWRHSRLRWLDSTVGLDDEVFAPYTPVRLEGRTVSVLGRRVRFNGLGLPESITSSFTRNVDAISGPPTELLAGPLRFVVETSGGAVDWRRAEVRVLAQQPGAVTWESRAEGDGLGWLHRAKMECDGYLNCRVTLRVARDSSLQDVRLEIPLRREAATYMMGLGRKGGVRPREWRWKWGVECSNNQFWLGDVEAGLSCKLKHLEDRWDLYNLKESGVYRDWGNDGKGGCTVNEAGDQVLVRAYSGPRQVKAGQELHFNFGLLVTPVKPRDRDHWQWRYFHQGTAKPVAEMAGTGATVINLHQGDALNPHINYPFLTTDRVSAYVAAARARGMKVKIYYTVRELSNYTGEFWALRSLGNEVFTDGPGFRLADQFLAVKPDAEKPRTGSSWLCEHVISGYAPAWHQPLGKGHCDAALGTAGLSRWHNYYLEGLDWLIRNVGIDGLYLDGIGYDREIMKRVRKVMQRARPGCLIDFHSGNNFHPEYGLNNCANQYLELFPCVDSLWFGEGFDYNEPPDYWLVEISGIPYGLFGEMLQGGGNPWRGMLYGLSNRLGWGGDPRELWKVWDQFGIQEARMFGYWDRANPVQSRHTNVLATAYLKKDKALIALASWAKEPVSVRLDLDERGFEFPLSEARLCAPLMPGFQDAATFKLTDAVPVQPGKGWLLILDTGRLPR